MHTDLTPRALRDSWLEHGLYDELDLYQTFSQRVAESPDKLAVVDSDREVTYAELLDASHRLANLLVEAGVQPGDVVAVQLPNSWMSCAIDFAIAALGAIGMPFPAHYRTRELQQLLERSQAVAYVGSANYQGENFLDMVEALQPSLPTLRSIIVDVQNAAGVLSVEDALGERGCPHWTPRIIDPRAGCRVFVTSGTESFPKMVLYSHQALGLPFKGMQADMGVDGGSRMYPGVPLGSGMGVQVCALISRHGATAVLTPPFKPDLALHTIQQHRVTHFYGVPTMVQMMLAHPDFETCDVSSLTTIVVAGSSIPADLAVRLRREYGWDTISFYGCSDGISINTGRFLPVEKAATTVGRSDERVSVVKIVDAAGGEKPRGEAGEIAGIGPFTPMCYLNSPELDSRYRTEDGWVRSGDLGVMDDEGFVSIVGRSKDIVIRGGFNISPQEVDDLLVTHPDVVLASCIAVPHERLGEQLCAVVVLRPGAAQPTVESLGNFLLDMGLSKYKLPERLLFRPELPTNPVGKILKRVLREEVARELSVGTG